MTGLQIDAITVNYGKTPALQEFSLDVAEGEIMAVLGPSGSGKSTLLRAVAGLEPLVAGTITLGGRDLSGVPTHRRGLGMMFQDHGLFAHMNVAANIGYGLRTAGVAKQAQRTRVAELLELVGLDGFEERGTDQLSGGEAQRVALARALAPQPGLLMLDEPLGSLDRALRDQLTADLRQMLLDIGQTALHVTHDQSEAFAVADRVAVVSAGRLMAVGPPAKLWSDPGTVFVAEFFGHPNIWTVTVDGQGVATWGPHLLGQLSADHPLRSAGPGRRTVVVPTTAVQPARERTGQDAQLGQTDLSGVVPELKVVVRSSIFRHGLYDVAAVTSGEFVEAWGIRFTTAHPVAEGDRVTVTLDTEMLRPLTE